LRCTAEEHPFWTSAYTAFVERLALVEFGGVVLDYDGTLCDARQRYGSLVDSIGNELVRLLRGGAALGIATGRGVSVQTALREVIPDEFWSRLWVGYYNAGYIARLDEELDARVRLPADELLPLISALEQDTRLSGLAEITARNPQVTIQPKNPIDADAIFALVVQRVATTPDARIRVVRSSHSLDVLGPGVSKLALVRHLKGYLDSNQQILCIGDRGRLPGNDFELLSTPYSLSVDEVSSDSQSCWNLAPPGTAGQRLPRPIFGR